MSIEKLIRYRNGKKIKEHSVPCSGLCVTATSISAASTTSSNNSKILPAYDQVPSWKGRMKQETSMSLENWTEAEDKCLLHILEQCMQRYELYSKPQKLAVFETEENLNSNFSILHKLPILSDGTLSIPQKFMSVKPSNIFSHTTSSWYLEYIMQNADTLIPCLSNNGMGGGRIRSGRQIKQRIGYLYNAALQNKLVKMSGPDPALVKAVTKLKNGIVDNEPKVEKDEGVNNLDVNGNKLVLPNYLHRNGNGTGYEIPNSLKSIHNIINKHRLLTNGTSGHGAIVGLNIGLLADTIDKNNDFKSNPTPIATTPYKLFDNVQTVVTTTTSTDLSSQLSFESVDLSGI